MDERLRVDLCHDHFQRLCGGDVCSTCPSKLENEKVVRAMSAALGQSEETRQAAIISELHSIRQSQSDLSKRVTTVGEKVDKNIADTAGIRTAISGDPSLGHVGIAHQIEEHGKQLSGLEKFKVRVMAAAAAIGSTAGAGMSWVASFLGK